MTPETLGSNPMAVMISMALDTERYEICFRVVPQMTSRIYVMHFEVNTRTTVLATPSIPLEHLAPQFPIACWAELEPWPPSMRAIHEAVRICSRNSTF